MSHPRSFPLRLAILQAVSLSSLALASAQAAFIVQSMDPLSGPPGSPVVITGSGFVPATTYTVDLAGVDLAVEDVTGTSLRFTVPAGAGSGAVRLAAEREP